MLEARIVPSVPTELLSKVSKKPAFDVLAEVAPPERDPTSPPNAPAIADPPIKYAHVSALLKLIS